MLPRRASKEAPSARAELVNRYGHLRPTQRDPPAAAPEDVAACDSLRYGEPLEKASAAWGDTTEALDGAARGRRLAFGVGMWSTFNI